MKTPHITKGSVFKDLGFNEAESIHLKAKADLMLAIRAYIEEHQLTQRDAAEELGVDQPQVSRLLKGNIDLFTIDKLLVMLARIKLRVKWTICEASRKSA